MNRVQMDEPRAALAPLQVNTALPHDTSQHKGSELTVKAKVKRSKESRRSSSKEKEAHAALPHTIAADDQQAETATAYPPLRAVLSTPSPAAAKKTCVSEIANDAGQATDFNFRKETVAEREERDAATVLFHAPASDGSQTVFVHPPNGVKPQVPSRRGSMARLRQQQQSFLQQKSSLEGENEGPVVEEERVAGTVAAEARCATATAAAAAASPEPILDQHSDSNKKDANSPANGLHTEMHVFSYRPTFTSLTSASAASDASARHTPEKLRGDEAGSRETTCRAAGGNKVLPKELRSPSGGTEMGVVAEDSDTAARHETNLADDNSRSSSSNSNSHERNTPCDTRMSPFQHLASGRYPVSLQQHQQQLPGAALTPSEHPESASTAPLNRKHLPSNGAPAAAPEASAPFHALQFVLPSNQDPFMSPPHSGRSEFGGNGNEVNSGCVVQPATTVAAAVVARAASGGEGDRAKPASASIAVATQQPCNGASPREYLPRHSSSGGGVCVEDEEELVVCPFALFGCCARGTHTTSELQENSTLHHHLVAVAGCFRRMKARQQQLEQTVLVLQNQVQTQAGTLRATTKQLNSLKWERKPDTIGKRGGRGGSHRNSHEGQRALNPLGSREANTNHKRGHVGSSFALSAADVSLSDDTMKSDRDSSNTSEEKATARSSTPRKPKSGDTCKALPEDVSLHEPQVTDYGAEEEDTEAGDDHLNGSAAEAEDECGGSSSDERCAGDADEGDYARQLRQRTQSAKQLYALRDSPAGRAPNCDKEKDGGALDSEVCPAEKGIPMNSSVSPRLSRTRASTAQVRQTSSTKKATEYNLQRSANHKLHATSAQRSERGIGSTVAFAEQVDLVQPMPTGSSTSPASAHGYPYDVQRGACGSTEVSGMSNVPPYQLPNESVSTISSASFDLDDREDDLEVGAMRRQLQCLSTEDASTTASTTVTTAANAAAGREAAAPTAGGGETNSLLRATREHRALHRSRRVEKEDGPSARSTPSLVSTTYRPSQFAEAAGPAGASASATASELPSDTQRAAPAARTASTAVGEDSNAAVAVPTATIDTSSSAQQQCQPPEAAALAAPLTPLSTKSTVSGGVRHAVALQRPALIRKADVAAVDRPPSHKPPVILPRATTPTTAGTATTTAPHTPALPSPTVSAAVAPRSSTATPNLPTVSIINKTPVVMRPRRLSSLDSEGRRVTAVGIEAAATTDEHEASPFGVRQPSDAEVADDGREEPAQLHVTDEVMLPLSSAAPATTRGPASAHAHLHGPPMLDVQHLTANSASSHARSFHRSEEAKDEDLTDSHSTRTMSRKRIISSADRDGATFGARDNIDDRNNVNLTTCEGAGSSRRGSLSRSRHGAAASRRPQHATSLLSTKEAGEFDAGLPLGLPPRRDNEF